MKTTATCLAIATLLTLALAPAPAAAEIGEWIRVLQLVQRSGASLEIDDRQPLSTQAAEYQERFAAAGFISAFDPVVGAPVEVPFWESAMTYSCDFCEAERLQQCDMDPMPLISDRCSHCFPYFDPCFIPGADAVDCRIVVMCVPHPEGGWTCWIGCGTEV